MVARVNPQPGPAVTFFVRVAAVLDQKAHHRDVGVGRRAAQGVHPALVLGMDIGALVEQQPQDVHRSGIAGGDEQRRAPEIGGPRIDIGAVLDQQFHFREIGDGPHQGRRASRIRDVGIRAAVEQQLHGIRVPVQGRRHQRRRAVGVARIRAQAVIEQALDRRGISLVKGLEQRLHRRGLRHEGGGERQHENRSAMGHRR